MKTCLIIKTSALGDVIQSLQVARYIKEKDPSFVLHWVAEAPDIVNLLKKVSWIDKVIPVQTKKWRKNLWKYRKEIFFFIKELKSQEYDLVFDLQGNVKSALILLFSKALEKVGYHWKSVAEKWTVITTTKKIAVTKKQKISSFYLEIVQRYFGEKQSLPSFPLWLTLDEGEKEELKKLKILFEKKPVYLCCFGSQWPHKRLSQETALAFLSRLKKAYTPTFIFIYHSKEEEHFAHLLAEKIGGHPLGNLSLSLLQHLMGLATWVIATDSAPLHLCGLTTTPSFGVFGPSSGDIYHPSPHFFQGHCPYQVSFIKRCPQLRSCSTGACLVSASPQTMLQAFAEAHNLVQIASIIGSVSPNKGKEDISSGENQVPSVSVPPTGSAT